MGFNFVADYLTNDEAKTRYKIAKDARLSPSWAQHLRHWTLPHFSRFILDHIQYYDIEPIGTLKTWLDGEIDIGGSL